MNDEENVLYGGPASPPIDSELTNLGDIFLKKLTEYGDKVLIINATTGEERTSREFIQKAIRLAECLRYLGAKKGDAIGICSENHMEFPVAIYATFLLGGILSPLSPYYLERELEHAVNLSKPTFILSTNLNLKNVLKIAKNNCIIKHVIAFETHKFGKGTVDYNELLNNRKISSNPDNFQCNKVDDNDTVVVLISSGTTGLPKGVEITHFNMRSCFEQLFEHSKSMKEALNGDVRAVSIMPWYHSYGLFSTMGFNLAGNTLITLQKFNDKIFLNAIQKNQANVLLSVPPIIVFLAKNPLVLQYNLSSLKLIGSGAAPLRKETIDAVNERLGPVTFGQGFGMSETTLGVLGQRDGFRSAGSVGCLRGGIWGKVVNVENGKNLGPNQEGELCFKGVLIMKGYIGNVNATQQAIDDKGWLHTGDVGYYDEKGEWFIVDRIKELIKFKGNQVPPAEIESLLLTHPSIIDAAVVGLPDEMSGELPLAFVVRKHGAKLTEKEVIDYIADKTSYSKRLHGGVRFIAEIPKNPSGKILRRVLKQMVTRNSSKL